MDSDIVILKLAKSLTFNKNVQPACLPDASFSPDTSKKPAVVSGWGTTKEGTLSYCYRNSQKNESTLLHTYVLN